MGCVIKILQTAFGGFVHDNRFLRRYGFPIHGKDVLGALFYAVEVCGVEEQIALDENDLVGRRSNGLYAQLQTVT